MYLNNILGVCLASATLAGAETIVIMAENLDFKPASVNASVGDVLEFHFGPNNHSVVMGDMTKPCQPASEGGFYSGFLPVSSGESEQVFRVTVNDTNPMVYYCSQNASSHNHCQGGMIGFVNQQDGDGATTYTSAAADSSINISPDEGPFGGVLAANSNNNGGNTTANATSTATSSGSSSTMATGTSTATATENTVPSSSSTGPPRNTNAGAAVAGSGLLAAVVALLAV